MKPATSSRGSPSRALAVVVLLMVLGALVILITGGGETRLQTPVSPAASLGADERGYVEFVFPRLEELVDETTAVTALVRDRSRNVLELNRRGNRISILASEITTFGDEHGIPKRYAVVDANIREGMTAANGTITKARRALVRFQFDSIPALVPEFAAGRDKLSSALADLKREIDDQATP